MTAIPVHVPEEWAQRIDAVAAVDFLRRGLKGKEALTQDGHTGPYIVNIRLDDDIYSSLMVRFGGDQADSFVRGAIVATLRPIAPAKASPGSASGPGPIRSIGEKLGLTARIFLALVIPVVAVAVILFILANIAGGKGGGQFQKWTGGGGKAA